MIIVYDNKCTPCARKQEWRDLRNFARANKLELKRIDIRRQPDYQALADSYNIDVPFVVFNTVAIKLGEPLEGLLA